MTRDDLHTACAGLGPDELKVLAFIARRLADGQRTYGRLDIATDRRCWRKERSEEFADAAVYHALVSLTKEPPP